MQHPISCLFAAVKCLNSGIFPSRFMLPVSIISLFGGKWKKKVPLGHLPGTLFLFHLLKKLTKCLIFLPDSILIHEISIRCLFVHVEGATRSSGVFRIIDPHSGRFIIKPCLRLREWIQIHIAPSRDLPPSGQHLPRRKIQIVPSAVLRILIPASKHSALFIHVIPFSCCRIPDPSVLQIAVGTECPPCAANPSPCHLFALRTGYQICHMGTRYISAARKFIPPSILILFPGSVRMSSVCCCRFSGIIRVI